MTLRARPVCRGFAGSPCARRPLGFGGLCAVHFRQRARARALVDMRELAGLDCPRPEPEERREDEEQAERYEDADGFVWGEHGAG